MSISPPFREGRHRKLVVAYFAGCRQGRQGRSVLLGQEVVDFLAPGDLEIGGACLRRGGSEASSWKNIHSTTLEVPHTTISYAKVQPTKVPSIKTTQSHPSTRRNRPTVMSLMPIMAPTFLHGFNPYSLLSIQTPLPVCDIAVPPPSHRQPCPSPSTKSPTTPSSRPSSLSSTNLASPFSGFWEVLKAPSQKERAARQWSWHAPDPGTHWLYVTNDDAGGEVLAATQRNIYEANPYANGPPTLPANWRSEGALRTCFVSRRHVVY